MKEILLKNEKNLEVEFFPPMSEEDEEMLLEACPDICPDLLELLEFSNGVYINKIDAEFFCAKEIVERTEIFGFDGWECFGASKLGAVLIINEEGEIMQFGDPDGPELFWYSMKEFLEDERLQNDWLDIYED